MRKINGAYCPVVLYSLGLTDTPNIRGEAIANAQTQLTNPMNPQQFEQMRKLYGLPDNATAEQVIAAAQTNHATSRANATKVTDLTTQLTNTEAARVAAVAARADAIKQIAAVHVDKAIANGQIVTASREAEITALANAENFSQAVGDLGKRERVVKVLANSQTKDLGARKAEGLPDDAKAAGDEYLQLVNTAVDKGGVEFDQAWANARQTEPGKALWEKMHQKPAAAAKA